MSLTRPIKSAVLLDRGPASSLDGPSPQTTPGSPDDAELESDRAPSRNLDSHKTEFARINAVLQNLADRLNEFCSDAFAAHKEEIAKLSLEIARKILAQKISDADYEIESIVKEALGKAPVLKNVVVHLNPDDLTAYRKLQQDQSCEDIADVTFVPDADIGLAECLIETPKGIIESLIDQRLEQVGNALKKVR